MQAIAQFPIHLLLARLPAPPCRLLALGIELESALPILDQHGYRVQHIIPDAQLENDPPQSAEAAEDNALINDLSRENIEAPPGYFDGLLIAHHIEPLTIFNLAIDRLPLSGDLIIIDRLVHAHDESSSAHCFAIKEMIALAERSGFEFVECLDASAEVSVSLNDSLPAILLQGHRIRDNDKDNPPIPALIHFRKKTLPKWRIGILEKNQIDDMRDLFKKTFHHEMSRAFWEWKYSSSSARGLGVWEGNDLIAHYGGMGREIMYFGQPQTAVQIGDVMVDSNKRGILTKKGPIFLMMATFLERYIGYGKPYLIGYGFPNDRHMKLAEILGLYAEVGHMVECSWPPCSRFPLWGTRLQLLQQTPTDSEKNAIDLCWQRMAADFQGALIGVRDWRYLTYRYLNHPHHQYQIVLIRNRLGSKVRGILVLRIVSEGCELVDCVTPLTDLPLLVTHARRLAGMQGANRMFCRITANFAHLFEVADGRQQPVNIRIPTNIWSNGPSAALIKDHWWLMSGDMDFR